MTITKKKINRVIFLDFIRGIAALLVVTSHSLETFSPQLTQYHYGSLDLGMAGVLAFFLVSGFVIPFSLERYNSVKVFFVNRIFRIYPLYIVVFIIGVLLYRFNIVGSWEFLKNKIPQNVLYHILFIQDYLPKERFGTVSLVGGAWTLVIEWVWYIAFAMLYTLRLNKKHNKLLVICNILIFLLSILSLFFKLRLPPGRPVLLFCCFVGLYIYRFFSGEVSKQNFFVIVTMSLINIYFALYLGFDFFENPIFNIACVIKSYSLGFFIFFIFYVIQGKVTGSLEIIFTFLGRISYSLYLAHGIIISSVVYFFGNTSSSNIFIVLPVSILLAYTLYEFIEKPGVELGKKVVNRYFRK